VLPGDVRHGMTLDDVLDLFDLWRDEPPVQWMVQAYLDIKAKPAETLSTDQLNAFATTGNLP